MRSLGLICFLRYTAVTFWYIILYFHMMQFSFTSSQTKKFENHRLKYIATWVSTSRQNLLSYSKLVEDVQRLTRLPLVIITLAPYLALTLLLILFVCHYCLISFFLLTFFKARSHGDSVGLVWCGFDHASQPLRSYQSFLSGTEYRGCVFLLCHQWVAVCLLRLYVLVFVFTFSFYLYIV